MHGYDLHKQISTLDGISDVREKRKVRNKQLISGGAGAIPGPGLPAYSPLLSRLFFYRRAAGLKGQALQHLTAEFPYDIADKRVNKRLRSGVHFFKIENYLLAGVQGGAVISRESGSAG